MPKQLELIKKPDLTLTPEPGRTEPRLWVRRLKIWGDPAQPAIRDIPFRPGLNIVWSPGAGDHPAGQPQGTIGHGSGKTLFCRLLRYCMGEDRFAPEGQRERIAAAFPDGLVGAEVMLDGKCWAIVRPIGTRRRHMAVLAGNLDAVAAGDGAHTGMDPFLQAVESSLLTSDTAALIPGYGELRAWLTALAWLTRDQECRLDKVLDWRAASSGSDSPSRALSETQKLDAVRVLLRAITPAEHALRLEVKTLEEAEKSAERELEHRKWEASQTRSRLMGALNLTQDDVPEGPLAVEPLNKAARENLAKVAQVPADSTDIQKLRDEYVSVRDKAEEARQRLGEINGKIPEIENYISKLTAEFPSLSYEEDEATNPVCKICEVPIDRVLAEGCKLSHKLPDLEGIRQRHDRLKNDLDGEKKRLEDLKAEKKKLVPEEQDARQKAARLSDQLKALEKVRDERRAAWYEAQRLVDDVQRFGDILDKQAAAGTTAHSKSSEIEKKSSQIAAHRDEQAKVFQKLTLNFDAILRGIIGDSAQGQVKLASNHLELIVRMGGERSTAAIESLKILAFDLAVLCMSIEGETQLPAFLLHDSPREADLDLALYHQLFQFAKSLETYGDTPLFQYIMTTTTQPPADLLSDPWLCFTLHGAPAEKRLLQRDL